ncbi:MAG: nucleotidyltransferase family protein [Candidatus Omnitrophica bacterium]|nr:nucleotidyltransferase family protein [Candidatus Omnitrophota bacterium]
MLKEEKFLILASQLEYPKDLTFINDLTKKNFNWSIFFDLAKKNSLVNFLYKNLEKYEKLNFIPKFVKKNLEGLYYYNLARNIFILKEIKRLFKFFNLRNIKVIGLKGLFLSIYLYDDIDLRPTTDIDLLIKKEDLKKINKILCSLGYIQPPYFDNFFLKEETTPINSLVYKNYTLGIFVHLHTHIINTTLPIEFFVKKIPMENIWQKVVSLSFEDIEILMLSWQHLLLQLVHHSFCHNFDKLLFLYDIKQLLTKDKDLIKKETIKEEFKKFYSWELANFVFLKLEKLFKIKITFREDCPEIFNFFSRFKIPSAFYYFVILPDLKDKINFIKKYFLPSKYVIAQNLYISSDRIRFYHYLLRIKNNLFT